MKEFLEGLEIGEGKIKLSKDDIKSILAENGKQIKVETEKVKGDYEEEINTFKSSVSTLEKQLEGLPDSKELDKLKTEIATLKSQEDDRIAKEKASKEDEVLTNNIKTAFGDKKFVNKYTENQLINEIKTSLKDTNNVGKSAKEIFEELTKDQEGLFVNPNQPKDMDGMNQNISTDVTKEAFEKMGYKDRLNLKQENPDLYQSFVK